VIVTAARIFGVVEATLAVARTVGAPAISGTSANEGLANGASVIAGESSIPRSSAGSVDGES
jgi:hypothetical protein